jgi:hypothetical protein
LEQKEKKQHVSFSELRTWMECAYKHKLKYIDKISNDEQSHQLQYGSILHNSIENWLKNGVLDIEECEKNLRNTWAEFGFDSKEYIEKQTLNAKKMRWEYKHQDLDFHVEVMKSTFQHLPTWMNETFGDWSCISAEQDLYEDTGLKIGEDTFYFKGFIDAIILSKKPDKKGKIVEKIWILDWKTASPGGWSIEKQQDIKTWGQLAFYKKYWSIKENTNKKIGCAFVLLKKKIKNPIQILTISVGPLTIEKVDKKLTSFLKAMNNSKMFLKTKTSCRFCEYFDTQHCDQKLFYT